MKKPEETPQELRDRYASLLSTLAGLIEVGLESEDLDASGYFLMITLPEGGSVSVGAGSPTAIVAPLQQLLEKFTERSMEENRRN